MDVDAVKFFILLLLPVL